jgi:nucleotide-binding universal stress UspA family protein
MDSSADSGKKPLCQDLEAQIYRRILVCYDGSDNATRALQTAITMAKEGDGELSIVVAASTLGYPPRYRDRYYSDLRKVTLHHAKEQLSEALETAKIGGVPSAQGKVAEGHPADMILTRAVDVKPDLIVVGRRGLGGVQRFLLGSVSSAVVIHSKCDVLVVK